MGRIFNDFGAHLIGNAPDRGQIRRLTGHVDRNHDLGRDSPPDLVFEGFEVHERRLGIHVRKSDRPARIGNGIRARDERDGGDDAGIPRAHPRSEGR